MLIGLAQDVFLKSENRGIKRLIDDGEVRLWKIELEKNGREKKQY